MVHIVHLGKVVYLPVFIKTRNKSLHPFSYCCYFLNICVKIARPSNHFVSCGPNDQSKHEILKYTVRDLSSRITVCN